MINIKPNKNCDYCNDGTRKNEDGVMYEYTCFSCEMNQVILKYPNAEHEWYESGKWKKI